jgi:hypothetical protein
MRKEKPFWESNINPITGYSTIDKKSNYDKQRIIRRIMRRKTQEEREHTIYEQSKLFKELAENERLDRI